MPFKIFIHFIPFWLPFDTLMIHKKKKQKSKKGRGSTIKLVVKSNELVEARYMFDVWETRFFHSLIVNINKNDEDGKVYRLWFKDMKKNFQLKSNQSYDFLREAAISMAGKSVYIGWQSDKFRRGRMHRIIRFVDFLEKGQEGEGVATQEYVDVSIDKDIRPYLLDIKKKFNPETSRYTSYDLRNIVKLKPYATRMFELFKQMEYKGFRTIIVGDLKDMFEITDEYPRFSNFYQKVILGSVKAINKHTDLTIPIDKIEKIKKGRKVHALRFQILSKSDSEINILLNQPQQKTLFSDLEDIDVLEPVVESESDRLFEKYKEIVVGSFGVTASAFYKMLQTNKFNDANIDQAISVTRRAKYNQEIKKTVSGFFRMALKEGYTDAEFEAQRKKAAKAVLKAKRTELEAKIISIKDVLSEKINERIKIITNEDENITLRAIEVIKSNPISEVLIRSKAKSLGRKLKLDDYRKDENLRLMVITNIVTLEKDKFEDLLQEYNPKIEALSKELEALK